MVSDAALNRGVAARQEIGLRPCTLCGIALRDADLSTCGPRRWLVRDFLDFLAPSANGATACPPAMLRRNPEPPHAADLSPRRSRLCDAFVIGQSRGPVSGPAAWGACCRVRGAQATLVTRCARRSFMRCECAAAKPRQSSDRTCI